MKRNYLKNNFWSDNADDERYLTEYLTRGIFHKWNKKLEILTRICDYYSYMFRFYPDGRLVLQMMNANTKDTDSEWRGKDDCGHLEYETIDHMLVDWLDELKKNEGSYKFDEEIKFIESLFKPKKAGIRRVSYEKLAEVIYDSFESDREVSGLKELERGMKYMCEKYTSEHDREIINGMLEAFTGWGMNSLLELAKAQMEETFTLKRLRLNLLCDILNM